MVFASDNQQATDRRGALVRLARMVAIGWLVLAGGAACAAEIATARFVSGLSDASGPNPAYQCDAVSIRGSLDLTTMSVTAYDALTELTSTEIPLNVEGALNWGASSLLAVGRSQRAISRALICFDLTSLAGQAGRVTAARLTLTVRSVSFEGDTSTTLPARLALWRISEKNAGWVPGGAFGMPLRGAACWFWRGAPEAGWAGGPGCGAAGVDTSAEPISQLDFANIVEEGGRQITFELSAPEGLIDWISHPERNAGFLLRSDDLEAESSSGAQLVQFYGAGAAKSDFRPRLEVEYVVGDSLETQSAARPAWLAAP